MSRKKLLLVDDSNTVLMTEKMILGKLYDIVTANNGQEALEKIPVEFPDLVLLDVIMPKMGGFELCQKLRQQEITKSIPIIMVTTRGEEANVEKGFESGCNDYVTKPFSGIELLTKIKNQIGD